MKMDLISILPNEILHHIISKLSLKEAVQSSALSTSWRSLIAPFRVNLEAEDELNYRIIVESLAKSGTGFHALKLHLRKSDVAFAVCTSGVNGELHLNFSHHLRHHFSLIIDQTYNNSLSHRPAFSLIKTLHLRSIHHLAGEMVSDLCSSCPFLETLKLEKCEGLESIEVRSNDDFTCLKHFEMSDCCNIVRIVIESAHNLNSFFYKGVFPVIQLLNVPNLVNVALDFGGGLGDNRTFDCEDVIFLLSSIKDIQTLQLSSSLVQALCCAGVIYNKLDFQFSRLKDLKLICPKISSETRVSIACFLHITPSLEELELKMDEDARCVEFPFAYQNWHEPHLWRDYATVKNEACRLKHMKRIKMMGFAMERDEVMLMDLLLHYGINLKEMIVDDIWRVAKVPYSHLNYIKLKYLLIPCSDIDSYFVLIAV